MDLTAAKNRARELLPVASPSRQPVGFIELGRREGTGLGFSEQLASMTPAGFPFPDLILFGFTQLLGLTPYGPEEKLRWGLEFEFRGALFAFELRKFGLRFICEEASLDMPIVNEVLGRTRGLMDVVENFLSNEVVPAQLEVGAVTVRNMYEQLNERYHFLRREAEAAYQRPPPLPGTGTSDGVEWTQHDVERPIREGGSIATAAVDAYFSSLEHLFVIASAFVPNALDDGGLRGVLNANWGERARRVLDLSDASVKKIYDRLFDIREDWRNPLAHGGFHVAGASLYFHLPGVGALPARLRRTPEGVKAGFRLHQQSFVEICATFDEFDRQLRTGQTRHAARWAESGLDVAFDQASIDKYRAASTSDEEIDNLIERENYLDDMHANMDY